NRRGRGDLLGVVRGERTPHDRFGHAVEDASGVGDGLAAAALRGAGVEYDGAAAQLGDSGREGDPRTGRRLVEHHRDRLRPFERTPVEPVVVESVGEVEDRRLLLGRDVVVTQEMPHGVVSFSTSARIATARSASSSVSTRGGARRSRAGPHALMMSPEAIAASWTAVATSASRPTPTSSPRPETSVTCGSGRIAS